MNSPTEQARVFDDNDEFESYLEEALKDPTYRAGYEDALMLHRLLDELVARRRKSGLTQKQLAERMGVRQPAVSGFETESSDPKVSTLQRYARAVNACVRFTLESTSTGQSFRTTDSNYVPAASGPTVGSHRSFEASPAKWRDFSRTASVPTTKNEYTLAS